MFWGTYKESAQLMDVYDRNQKTFGDLKDKNSMNTDTVHQVSNKFLKIILLVCLNSILINSTLASPSLGCDYFASPTGAGNGLSQSSPFKIADFWSNASPGKTLCLLDGTYSGTDSVIDPPDNLNGSSGNPITVKALNEGKATLDGQDARRPVYLRYNDHFVLEGFNAHSSSEMVVGVVRSTNVTVRRVVAWDAEDGNGEVFGVHFDTSAILLEDVAAFGIARKIFSASQGGNDVVCRRCWGRWEGSHVLGPKMTYTLAYNNYDMTIENSIGTWSGERMQQTYQLHCDAGTQNSKCGQTYSNYAVDQPYGVFAMDRYGDWRSKLLGSIAYVTPSDRFPAPQLNVAYGEGSIEYNNNIAFMDSGSFPNKKAFALYNHTGSPDLLARNLTSIGGASSLFGPEWSISNIEEGGTSSDVGSVFTSPIGAQVCTRYKDRVLTEEPLWPWPMDQRIKEAITQSGHRSVTYGMADDTGYVTHAIEQMLGPIPSQCKTGSGASAPEPPTNLQFVDN